MFQALNKIIIESNSIDNDFIESKTKGYDEYCESLSNLEWSRVITDTGITRATIEGVAELLINSKNDNILLGDGINSTQNGVAVIQEVVNITCWEVTLAKRVRAYAPFVVIQMSKVTEL